MSAWERVLFTEPNFELVEFVTCFKCGYPRIKEKGKITICENPIKCEETTVQPMNEVRKSVFMAMLIYRHLIFYYELGDVWAMSSEEVNETESEIIKRFFK